MPDTLQIRQSPLLLLQNAVEVCVAYEDSKYISAESAQQQLVRVRHLILAALAALGEPNEITVERTRLLLRERNALAGFAKDEQRWARDCAAVIVHTALTWGIGDDVEADATGTP